MIILILNDLIIKVSNNNINFKMMSLKKMGHYFKILLNLYYFTKSLAFSKASLIPLIFFPPAVAKKG